MKIKIRIVIMSTLILLLFINSGNATTYENGSLELSIEASNTYNLLSYTAATSLTDTWNQKFWYGTESLCGVPDTFVFTNVKMVCTAYDWVDVPQAVGAPFTLKLSGDIKGYGSIYIRKTSVDHRVDIYYYFDSTSLDMEENTEYDLVVYNGIINQYFDSYSRTTSSWGNLRDACKCAIAPYAVSINRFPYCEDNAVSGVATYNYQDEFRNDYSIKFIGTQVETTIYRNLDKPLKTSSFILRNEQNEIYYNSGTSSVNYTYYNVNESLYYIIQPNNYNEIIVYTSIVESEVIINASLEFNRSSYNISDILQFEYSNLNSIRNEDDVYDLQLYYYKDQNEIEYVYNVPLRGSLDESDDIGYISSHGWNPNKLYYGVIRNDINYKSSHTTFLSNVELTGYINLTYPYEFINDTCTGDYCHYNNGDTITLVYNTYTDQNIYIIDGNNNIIQDLGIQHGFGTIEFVIPFDDSRQYNYPGWSTTMDIYYDNMSVYWLEESEYLEYISEPVYDEEMQEEIKENIDTMQDAFTPIKDLVIGMGGIIIENPDYDDNGIVESNEIDQWFNGIIGLIIVIAIYIFYNGLRRR